MSNVLPFTRREYPQDADSRVAFWKQRCLEWRAQVEEERVLGHIRSDRWFLAGFVLGIVLAWLVLG